MWIKVRLKKKKKRNIMQLKAIGSSTNHKWSINWFIKASSGHEHDGLHRPSLDFEKLDPNPNPNLSTNNNNDLSRTRMVKLKAISSNNNLVLWGVSMDSLRMIFFFFLIKNWNSININKKKLHQLREHVLRNKGSPQSK